MVKCIRQTILNTSFLFLFQNHLLASQKKKKKKHTTHAKKNNKRDHSSLPPFSIFPAPPRRAALPATSTTAVRGATLAPPSCSQSFSLLFSCMFVYDIKEGRKNSSENFQAICGVFRRVSDNHIEYVSSLNLFLSYG